MSERSSARERNAFDRVVDRRGTDSVKWSAYDPDVLPMWVADMDFPSPPEVVAALKRRADHGVFGYPAEPPELRGLFCERLARIYRWRVAEESLVFLPNVVVGFNLACQAAPGTGDGVLYQTPIYFPILRIPGNTGLEERTSELVPTATGRYEIDFDDFERAASGARVFILCNPHNPVSRVFSRDELEQLAETSLRRDIIVCSDEIHADFVYDDRCHVPIASLGTEIEQRSVTLFAPNKTYNIAGIPCAIAVVPNASLRRRLVEAKRGLVPHVGIMNYTAALAAYRHGDGWLRDLVVYLEANRDLVAGFVREELPGITVAPIEGTYLAWLDVRDAVPEDPHVFFLDKARVALNDGVAFGPGGKGFVRLNFACPRARLLEGLRRMRDALERG